jgi:hypothetical protein
MEPAERPNVLIHGDERTFAHAQWSRSGRRVILSVGRSWDEAGQVELTPEQALELARFLADAPGGAE